MIRCFMSRGDMGGSRPMAEKPAGAIRSGSGQADAVSPEKRESASRRRFLEAADEQFIAHGYDRCTIRAIAAQAGTSLASLSRNWDSKQHLFEEVFKRHFDPIHQHQHQQFDVLEQEGDLSVRRIVAAFFGSAIGKNAEDSSRSRSHLVYCLALTDPSEHARAIARPLVAPVRGRLIGLMRRALPDMDEQRFFLAMNIVLGVYIYPQTQAKRLAGVMDFDIEKMNWEEAVSILAGMVEKGLEGRG